MNRQIRYLVLSDIHLGNNLNKIENIIKNLKLYFKNNHSKFKHLDILFIAGDIFDKLLINSSKEFVLSTEWLTEIVMYCSKLKIKLRILEGTPSHDWQQAKMISAVITKLKLELDYKYVSTLHIEYMEDIDLTVLYVPDEYKNKAIDTYQEVLKLISANNLVKVDIAIMHGCFNYQLPMVELESSHDEELYLNLVKYYISIGHVHTASVFKRILAQGSFDRLAHNEEEDKGGLYITLRPDGDSMFEFIKNKHAKIFKTFKYLNMQLTDIIDQLNKDLINIPYDSHIRLIVSRDSSLTKNVRALKDKYIGYIFKVEHEKEKNALKHSLLAVDNVVESFNITRFNIEELLTAEMIKHDLSKSEMSIFKSELELILNSV